MKTAETQMTTIQQIKSIISPLRVLKVSDFEKIVSITYSHINRDNDYGNSIYYIGLRNIISRYESLTSQPLTKEMFVCQVEKPNKVGSFKLAIGEDSEYVNKLLNLYQAALKKLWFEGFENTSDYYVENSRIGIDFQVEIGNGNINDYTVIDVLGENQLEDEIHLPINATVSDLIYHISKFNETASKPVEINVTDIFIQELIK